MVCLKSTNTIKTAPLQNYKTIWKHFRFIEISIYLKFDFVLLTVSTKYITECTVLCILPRFHIFKLTHGHDYPCSVEAILLAKVVQEAEAHLHSRLLLISPRGSRRPGCGKGMPARQAPGVGSMLRCGLQFTQDDLGQLGPVQRDSGQRPKIDLKQD